MAEMLTCSLQNRFKLAVLFSGQAQAKQDTSEPGIAPVGALTQHVMLGRQAANWIFFTINSTSVHTTRVHQIPDAEACFDLVLTDVPVLFFHATQRRVCGIVLIAGSVMLYEQLANSQCLLNFNTHWLL